MYPSIDFETYSEAGYRFDKAAGRFVPLLKSKPGIKCVNSATYAMHPSTDIICLAYNMRDGRGEVLWWPWDPAPVALLNHVAAGGIVEAHKSVFEWYIWFYQCYSKRGWPMLPLEQMRCSMSKAMAYCLPGALDPVSNFLTPGQAKDPRGKQLIRLLSVPQKPTKNQPLFRRDAYRFPDLWREMGEYCQQDIRAEDAVSAALPALSPFELELWLLDQRINTRGVAIDTEGLEACKDVWHQAHDKYTAELQAVTGGQVQTIDEISKGSGGDKWLQSMGINLPSLDKKSVDSLIKNNKLPLDSQRSLKAKIKANKLRNGVHPTLELLSLSEGGPLPPAAHRALEIKQLLGSSSAKKIFAIDRILNPDGRIRDLFQYCGAEKTGRWAGRGPQPQNLKNHGPECFKCTDCGRMWAVDAPCCGPVPVCPQCMGQRIEDGHEWEDEAAEFAVMDLIFHRDLKMIERLWGNAVELIASLLRSLFVAAPGYDFICSDYSAIEAVGLAALAGEEWRLEVFRTHGKIYEMSAAKIAGITLEEMLEYKKQHGKHHPLRKKLGKIAELGSGYGGWVNAWKNFGADKFMSDEEIKSNIIKWRDESPMIPELWGGQWRKHPQRWEWWPERYGVEGAAVNAMEYPQYTFGYRDLSFMFNPDNDVLYLTLPSGRSLCYHQPRMEKGKSPAGNEQWNISFFGRLGDNTGRWGRRETFGPRFVENATQGSCRDVQACALVRVDKRGYHPVLHVHDEIVAEIPQGWGSVEELEALMMVREPWFKDWPIRAAGGWRGRRYRK